MHIVYSTVICGVRLLNIRGSSYTNEEQNAANAMISRFVESWNKADGAACGEGYWTDAELVDPTGKIWNGRVANCFCAKYFFRARAKVSDS
jgi:hypothetical protein